MLELEISSLEKQIAEADKMLANPSKHQQTIDSEWYKQYSGMKKNLATTMESWEQKHLQMDELQSLLNNLQ